MGLLAMIIAFVLGALVAIVPYERPRELPWIARQATLLRLNGLGIVAALLALLLGWAADWLDQGHPDLAALVRMVRTGVRVVTWAMRTLAMYSVGRAAGDWLRPRIGRS